MRRLSWVCASVSSSGAWGQNPDLPVPPSATVGTNPEERAPLPPQTPVPDIVFLGRPVRREGQLPQRSLSCPGPSSAGGSPNQQLSAAARSSGGQHLAPRAAPAPSRWQGEASGRVSCCYLSLMTRSVNFVGNTPSRLCMPPALITVIEL